MVQITPQNYVFNLGKYKGMKTIDIAKLKTIDKNGKERATGLSYLEWIIKQVWFRHIDIITKVIDEVKNLDQDTEHDIEQEDKPKVEKKKKKDPKTVKISTTEQDKTLHFQ